MNKNLAKLVPLPLLFATLLFQFFIFKDRVQADLPRYLFGPYGEISAIFDLYSFSLTHIFGVINFLLISLFAILLIFAIANERKRQARLIAVILPIVVSTKFLISVLLLALADLSRGGGLDYFRMHMRGMYMYWFQTPFPTSTYYMPYVTRWETLTTILLVILTAVGTFLISKNFPEMAPVKQARVRPQPVPQNMQQQYTQQPVYQQPQYFQPPQAPVQDSMTSQLAELERMFESGTLTKTEFTAAKKRILGS